MKVQEKKARSYKMRKICMVILATTVSLIMAIPAISGEKRPVRADKEKRQEIRKKMDLLRNWRLMDELELDEEQAIRFFNALKGSDEREHQLMDEGLADVKKLRDALGNEKIDEKEIQALLNKMNTNMNAMHELRNQRFSAIKSILTIKQQAKFVLFEMNFRKDMVGLAGKAMNMGFHPPRDEEPGRGPEFMPHRP
jgi:Spy/CpxP family protein refolding chaperone